MLLLENSEAPASDRGSRRIHGKYHGPPCFAALCALLGAFALLTGGCGASYQSIYEGEVRFEHCHRLDLEPSIPLTQRRECWREWTKFYTYGQTRDRLEYALRRQRELTAKIENPGAETSNDNEPVDDAPPIDPHAPPPHVQEPKTSNDTNDESPPDSSKLVEMLQSKDHPSAQPCLLQCVARWHTCTNTCDSKDDDECREGCDAAFENCCMQCFER